MTGIHSPLLKAYLAQVSEAVRLGPILDLACGHGRNGLYLLRHGLPVIFADRDRRALRQLEQALAEPVYDDVRPLAQLWPLDIERASVPSLAQRQFGAIVVFRYLHRPVMADLARAVCPGGLVVYETFTIGQRQFGHPRNPDYLLQSGELPQYFAGWDVLHQFEGQKSSESTGARQVVAQVIARRPA